MTEPTYLYLTTRGRTSGRPREIEIWFTRYEGRYYLVAEHREKSQWVQNLRANSHVQVRVGDAHFPARARVVDARKEPALAREIRHGPRRSTAGVTVSWWRSIPPALAR